MPDLIEHVRNAGFPYSESLIHLFVGGSGLHGAKLEGTDDHDIYGVFIEPPEKLLGLDRYEHFVWSTSAQTVRNGPGDVDITLYSLRKWAGLAAKGNPTCLHFLFADNVLYPDLDSMHLVNGYQWMDLFAKRDLFLSKACAKQFMGFVNAQLGRLTGERGRGKKGQRPELEQKFGYDVKAGMHSIRLLYECMELMRTGYMTFPRPEREMLIHIRQGGWSLDRLIAHANVLFMELKQAVQESKLPDEVDRNAISKFITELYREYWGD